MAMTLGGVRDRNGGVYPLMGYFRKDANWSPPRALGPQPGPVRPAADVADNRRPRQGRGAIAGWGCPDYHSLMPQRDLDT